MTIREFFTAHPRAAIAFSGGVDSTYLLCAAKEAGADITAYYVRSQFQPAFEFEDAVKMAELTEIPESLYLSYEAGMEDLPFTFMHKCALAFGVEIAVLAVPALTDGAAVLDQDAPDQRVRGGVAVSPVCKGDRLLHVLLVCVRPISAFCFHIV